VYSMSDNPNGQQADIQAMLEATDTAMMAAATAAEARIEAAEATASGATDYQLDEAAWTLGNGKVEAVNWLDTTIRSQLENLFGVKVESLDKLDLQLWETLEAAVVSGQVTLDELDTGLWEALMNTKEAYGIPFLSIEKVTEKVKDITLDISNLIADWFDDKFSIIGEAFSLGLQWLALRLEDLLMIPARAFFDLLYDILPGED